MSENYANELEKFTSSSLLQSTVKSGGETFFYYFIEKQFSTPTQNRELERLQFNELLIVVVQKSSRLFLMLDLVLLLVVSPTA